MKMNFCVPVGAFFVGIVLGFWLAPTESAPEKAASAPATTAPKKKAMLPKREVPRAQEESPVIMISNEGGRSPGTIKDFKKSRGESHAGGPREYFERMKKERPDEFIRMTNGMAQAKAERRAQLDDNLSFLASLDTSKFSEEAASAHERLQELLQRRAELSEKTDPLAEPPLSEDERREAFRELMKIHTEINELNKGERDTLFKAVAEEVGCAAEDTETFVETLNDIIDATGGNFGGFGPRRNPPPRPPKGAQAK